MWFLDCRSTKRFKDSEANWTFANGQSLALKAICLIGPCLASTTPTLRARRAGFLVEEGPGQNLVTLAGAGPVGVIASRGTHQAFRIMPRQQGASRTVEKHKAPKDGALCSVVVGEEGLEPPTLSV